METSFLDVRSPQDPRWPQVNEAALWYAYAVAEQDRDPWCLFTCWRHEFPIVDNWVHLRWVIQEQLPRETDVQILVAHYRGQPGERTRVEPWIFAAREVDRSLVESLLRRHAQDLAFFGEGPSVHAVTPSTSRCLGDLRPGVIAHAISESAAARSGFLAYDLPAHTWVEALARTACVGASTK